MATSPTPKCIGRPDPTRTDGAVLACDKAPWKAKRCSACYMSVRRDALRTKPKRPPAEDLGGNPVKMRFAMPAELGGRFYATYAEGARARVLRTLLREHLDSLS